MMYDWKVARSAMDPDRIVAEAEANDQFQIHSSKDWAGSALAVAERAKSQLPMKPAAG